MQNRFMLINKRIAGVFVLGFIPFLGFSQILPGEIQVDRETDIKEESVIVERRYSPKVEAANKIKPSPSITFPAQEKNPLIYETLAFDVASEFETSVIESDDAELQLDERYKNYIRGGYGNNSNLRLDGFYIQPLNENRAVGADFRYAATNPNINKFDNKASDFQVSGFIKQQLNNAILDGSIGVDYSQYNLYGIPFYLKEGLSEDTDLNVKYTNIWLNANYEDFNNSIIKNAFIQSGYLSDNFKSSEVDFTARTLLGMDDLRDSFLDSSLGAEVGLAVGYNRLTQDRFSDDANNQWAIEASPRATFKNDYAKLSIGPKVAYAGVTSGKSKFYIFPDLAIEFSKISQFALYGSLSGGVDRVNLHTRTQENPYQLSNLNLVNSVEKIKIEVGIKGDFNDSFKYDVNSSFAQIDDHPFFVKSPTLTENQPYSYQNSFMNLFDDVQKIQVKANLKYIWNEDLNFGGAITLQSFEMNNLTEAYEVPSATAQVDANYKFWNERILLEGNLFFNGPRKGLRYMAGIQENQITELDAYIDLNSRGTYLFNERLSFFIEGKNLLNNSYERFTDYEVQGVQVLGGLMFKF